MKLKINLLIIILLSVAFNSFSQGGVINNGANLVIENGITFIVSGTSVNFINNNIADNQFGTIDLDGNIVLSGHWINDLSHNVFINENNDGTVLFNGSAIQTISGLYLTNFENVKINNNQGVELDEDISISNSLNLSAGFVALITGNLKILENAFIEGNFSNQKLIITGEEGELQKYFSSSTGSFTFPVGNVAGNKILYSPVELTLNSASIASNASISVNVKGVKLPANSSLNDYLNRYWAISQDNFSDVNYDLLMYYDDDDIAGDEQNIYGAKFDGTTWQKFNQVNSSTNSISFTGLTDFSEFTGIEGDISVFDVNKSDLINIFPNPGNGLFFIQFSNNISFTKDAVVRVYSSNGMIILDKKLSDWNNLNNNDLYEFDISNYASGIYLINVLIDGKIFTKRLINN
ncbi:MAG: T9SS type A sorting domain-containing protein [Chlorobi bacterium]|nr:T9SS type A sorting domain-containing protein [Chlorobiota bacterium]